MASTRNAAPSHATSKPRRRTGKRPMLGRDVSTVDYKDVTLLRTFISDRGKIRSRRVTGLTGQQQRAVTRAVKNAREMALLPYASQHRPSSGPGTSSTGKEEA